MGRRVKRAGNLEAIQRIASANKLSAIPLPAPNPTAVATRRMISWTACMNTATMNNRSQVNAYRRVSGSTEHSAARGASTTRMSSIAVRMTYESTRITTATTTPSAKTAWKRSCEPWMSDTVAALIDADQGRVSMVSGPPSDWTTPPIALLRSTAIWMK
jgi:hypothetical protein